MKQRIKLFLMFVMLFTTMTAQAEVTCHWDEDTKTLTLSGSGEVTYDLAYSSGHRDDVKTVVIGSGVTSIIGAFYNCFNLTTVTFEPGSQLTSIGDNAFTNCSNLTSIAIPNSVTTIGFGAFSECYGLKSFIIPASVTSIENFAFFSCNLEIVVVQRYTSGESPITALAHEAFNGCEALKMICVPNDALDAYKNDVNWSQYYSPDMSINKIQAINNYCGDPYVNDGKNVYYAYYQQPNTQEATLAIAGSGAMDNYNAQPWLGFNITAVNIGYGVTSISQYAFYNRNGLTSVPIPASVTTIGNNAFEGCTGLTSITIPASVTSIGDDAFKGCTSLTSVTILGNPAIADGAFPAGATVRLNLTANAAEGAKWTTFYNNGGNFQADANTKVYKGTVSGSSLVLTEVEDRIVNSSTAVILKSTDNPVMTLTTTESADTHNNDLKGVMAETETPEDCYTLAAKGGVVGFYRYTGAKVHMGKAYLIYTGSGSSNFLNFDDDDVTGIDASLNDKRKMINDNYYDLSGRRVANGQKPTAKGVYIHNGRKEVIR